MLVIFAQISDLKRLIKTIYCSTSGKNVMLTRVLLYTINLYDYT